MISATVSDGAERLAPLFYPQSMLFFLHLCVQTFLFISSCSLAFFHSAADSAWYNHYNISTSDVLFNSKLLCPNYLNQLDNWRVFLFLSWFLFIFRWSTRMFQCWLNSFEDKSRRKFTSFASIAPFDMTAYIVIVIYSIGKRRRLLWLVKHRKLELNL